MAIIRTLLNFYMILLLVDGILSYVPRLNQEKWRLKIRELANLTCEPVRKKLPIIPLPIDMSPLIVIMLIEIFKFLW